MAVHGRSQLARVITKASVGDCLLEMVGTWDPCKVQHVGFLGDTISVIVVDGSHLILSAPQDSGKCMSEQVVVSVKLCWACIMLLIRPLSVTNHKNLLHIPRN